MKKLIIFTSSFPFGQKETYLETELKYLSEDFDKTEIYPYYYNNRDTAQREVPNNAYINKPVLPINKFARVKQGFFGVLKGAKILPFLIEFYRYKIFISKSKFIDWLLTLIDYSATYNSWQFRKLKSEKNCIFYFYWGRGWSFSLLDLQHNNFNTYFIRLHGGEVYLERSLGYIPLRKLLFNKAHFLLPISNHLLLYLLDVYNIQPKKLILSRLGVDFNALTKDVEDRSPIRLVSCSNVIPLKRIDLIIEALSLLDNHSIEWIHFGDGPEMNNLINKIKALNFKRISIEFKGRINNTQVLEYYQNNSIDAFINVSKHEGLPVSIMEAMSCGIPCIATDAGATREIVNAANGILLQNNFLVDDLVDAIITVRLPTWNEKKDKAFAQWDSMFNAAKNYRKLSYNMLNRTFSQ